MRSRTNGEVSVVGSKRERQREREAEIEKVHHRPSSRENPNETARTHRSRIRSTQSQTNDGYGGGGHHDNYDDDDDE